MSRNAASKVAILTCSAILVAIGAFLAGNSVSLYFYFIDRLGDSDARDCAGQKCFCNNLMCRTEAMAREETLKDVALAFPLMAGGSFWIILFSKKDYLKTRRIF
jgi:hypothetical protein